MRISPHSSSRRPEAGLPTHNLTCTPVHLQCASFDDHQLLPTLYLEFCLRGWELSQGDDLICLLLEPWDFKVVLQALPPCCLKAQGIPKRVQGGSTLLSDKMHSLVSTTSPPWLICYLAWCHTQREKEMLDTVECIAMADFDTAIRWHLGAKTWSPLKCTKKNDRLYWSPVHGYLNFC